MTVNNLTTSQIENIPIDYALIYLDYGEATQLKLGPTKGTAEFVASKTIRDIDYDGKQGKTKGMQVIEEINAVLRFTMMDTTLTTIGKLMPHASYDAGTSKITNDTAGVIAATKYLTNVTAMAKVAGGGYKMITLYNAMNEADFGLKTAAKSEGEVAYEVYAHWDPTDLDDLFVIEDLVSISDDVAAPTAVTVPVDAAPAVNVDANLTATFNEAIRAGDVTTANFRLIKASDGTIVAGAISYDAATHVVTFNPTGSLGAATEYIWTIGGVRDIAGNLMTPVAVNFTTA